jgi:hypothetical protein
MVMRTASCRSSQAAESEGAMTPEEINLIIERSTGKLTDWQCRTIVHYMMGYLRYATDLEAVRDTYFQQIKHALNGGHLPVL